MEIRQKFTVEQDIETVWTALSDIRLVASCMPGAEILSVSDDQSDVEGRIRTKVGPINAAFGGRCKVVRDDANYKGTVDGNGADKNSGSRVQIKLVYQLEPGDGGKSTTTSIVSGIVLSGPLAQFGKGALISEIAAQMTQQFTGNLRQSLAPPAGAEMRDPKTLAGAIPSPASAGELRPLRILLAVLTARFLRLFRARTT